MFLASLIANVVFVILSTYLVIHYRGSLIAKIHSIVQRAQNPSDEILSKFNNEPLEAVNDSLMVRADRTITCLFLGNSLTYTGVPEEEPNKEKRGLTSTSKEKDYVHVLVGLMAENHHVNVKYSIVNISGFERTFTKRSFQSDRLANVTYQQPDYLVVQIGENVAKDDMESPSKFEEEYLKLLSLFPNSKKIITIPFWPDKEKEYAVTRIAIKSKSYLVDLAHLGSGTDPKNFASSYRDYSQAGVGDHPGDYGMLNIAQCIYTTINAIENN